jgi:hypothetical protein
MHCPLCGGKFTGKIGVEQYYCWDCCVEYRKNNNELQIYEVAEDGTLVAYDSENELMSGL